MMGEQIYLGAGLARSGVCARLAAQNPDFDEQ
jgi:hypothetical protein